VQTESPCFNNLAHSGGEPLSVVCQLSGITRNASILILEKRTKADIYEGTVTELLSQNCCRTYQSGRLNTTVEAYLMTSELIVCKCDFEEQDIFSFHFVQHEQCVDEA
jgi:hypothetical protein